jgi:trans-AT polyketide synthase, acyltransferase and oxidoreductase domains
MKAYLFPGQGSQSKGMGGDLFDDFPELVAQADKILGYSIVELCLQNPNRQLLKTQFTQPALYVVSCLSYLKALENGQSRPDFFAGHSLGEYVALFAADVYGFATGLRLVKRRGKLMSHASGGTMAAVKEFSKERIEAILWDNGLTGIDFANYNTPTQIVLSGPKDEILKAKTYFEEEREESYFLLNVSAPFHSRYMEPVTKKFAVSLEDVTFSPPSIPVIANRNARPYGNDMESIKQNLLQQIQSSVQWVESIHYLMGQGVTQFEEIGPGDVLTKLVKAINKTKSN